MEYNFTDIEKRWQKEWVEKNTYKVAEDKNKKKFYVLNMFPYPSGAGLHVGHPLGYIASDIYARYKRLKGFNVLNPMGYDAYGLPAEQYAIQTGQHPAITTVNNINRYREQLDKIGFSFDWDREVRTCDPGYYKWTQWAFQKMFQSYYCNVSKKAQPIYQLIEHFEKCGTEALDVAQSKELEFTADEWNAMDEKQKQETLMNYRIAYLGETMVNWCPMLGTVLANDEVVDGVSERGGYPVVQKKMRQWCLRVSAYAQRLLDGLDTIDWTDSLKETQRNWIGRSEGTEVRFRVAPHQLPPLGGEPDYTEGGGQSNQDNTHTSNSKVSPKGGDLEGAFPQGDLEGASIVIFTTRADTMFGVTFMVLAPESEYVTQVTTPEQQAAVDEYLAATKKRTERERISDRRVSGVFTGSYAINPFTNDEIPIWISDYVLAGYGTGAIMAVPAHDSRDYAFAKHFNLPIIPLIEGADVSEESYDAKEGIVCNSPAPHQLHPLGEEPDYTKGSGQTNQDNTHTSNSKVSPKGGDLEGAFPQGDLEGASIFYKTADPYNYDILKDNSKFNRKNPTEAEDALWEVLKRKSLGQKFRRQHVIGDFIVDFVCLSSQLIIEVDGGYHNDAKQIEEDKLRTQFLNEKGFNVIRFTNEEIFGDIETVISTIKDNLKDSGYTECNEQTSNTHRSNYKVSPKGGDLEGASEGALVLNGLTVKEAIAATKKYVKEHNMGRVKVNYRLRDAIFSRQRYWGEPFPVYYKDNMPYMIPEDKLPLELPEIDEYKPTETGEPPLGHAKVWAWDTQNNCVVENSKIDNINVFPLELNTMPGFAGSSAYYLRYMDPHNDECLVSKDIDEYWQNVDLYVGGTEHATGHLIYSRFWNKFLHDIGISAVEEPFKKLVNQGMIQGRSNFVYRIKDSNTFVSLNLKDKYDVTPIHVDVNMVHGDVLDINTFKSWRPEYENAEFLLEDGKYVCGWAVEKMSKSMYNVVNPDMIVERYGADTLRLYEMFLGPVEQSKPWDTNGIDGCHRFLRKFWALFYGKENTLQVNDELPTPEQLKSVHKLIKKVSYDIENFSYNTSIAAFMICVNELTQLKCHNKTLLQDIVVLIAPFAPHIAEELWHALGNNTTVCDAQWPEYDEKYLVESKMQLTVSFNGKARFQMEFPVDADNKTIENAVLNDEKSAKYLNDKQVVKIIIVPKKIVNIVVK
ncbi:MAG: class I tRNA ligase family protein [Prevotella sp.]|nr:class I tRNA ligase family protein [Prevotella sp.]